MSSITIDDKLDIIKYLESSHSLFRKFWDLGEPIFTNDILTAAVGFNTDGELINFSFNEDFWNKLTPYDRAFTIAHESLHVILEHGKRINDEDSDKDIANQAMDVCVNQLLIDEFGFDRDKLTIEKIMGSPLCWYDELFKNSKIVEKNREAEYYYNILMRLKRKNKTMKGVPLDSHMNSKEAQKIISKVLGDILKDGDGDNKISSVINKYSENKENNVLQNALARSGLLAGFGTGSWNTLKKNTIKIVRKWESVIKKKEIYSEENDIIDVETFIRKNKRLEFFLSDDIIIPTEYLIETRTPNKNKVDLFMFLDNSGSCKSYAQKFYNAYKSINKKKFEIRIFSFDTIVQELDPDNYKIYGGGGTSFSCIENEIQSIIKRENKKYPFVFIVTDGYGNSVLPEKPHRWHWFLTEGASLSFLPKGSSCHSLKDFIG